VREEEKEEVRALTRGLHEAIQDANAAAARLRAERRQIENSVAESVAHLLDDGRKMAVQEMQGVLDDCLVKIRGTVAEAAGIKGPDEFFELIVEQVIAGIRPLIDRAVEKVLDGQAPQAAQNQWKKKRR
jgi:hypothetical protein